MVELYADGLRRKTTQSQTDCSSFGNSDTYEARLCAEFALVYTEQRQASQARNAHTQLMDLGVNPEILAKFSMCIAFQSIN